MIYFGGGVAPAHPSSLVSCPAPFMHAREGSGQKGRTSLSSRYVYCDPIRLQNHGHMILVECNYALSVRTHVRTVYAHSMRYTEVSVSFYCTHTRIANYCIPAGRVSATLLTRHFLARAGHETTQLPSPDNCQLGPTEIN